MRVVLIGAALVAMPCLAAPRFVASDVVGAGIRQPGRIVISNDSKSVTAFQFFGDIRRALVTLKSIHTLQCRPYGAVLFDSSAPVSAQLPAPIAGFIREAASTHGLDPRLIAAIARNESAFDPGAVSNRGAQGIMQLMPETARFLGVTNVFDARDNIFGGARYLKMLLATFRGDLDLTLAAYNAGPGAVERYRGVPPFRETMRYVAAVRTTYERSLAATASGGGGSAGASMR